MRPRAGIRLVPSRGALEEVAAILNRPQRVIRHERPDNCPDCQALRRTTFRCGECGYRGVPHVAGCSCLEDHAHEIESYRRNRERAAQIGNYSGDGLSVSYCEEGLALLEAVTPKRCRVGEERPSCCHGWLSCPVCSDAGDGEGARTSADHAYKIIRDLRRLLRSLGVQA